MRILLTHEEICDMVSYTRDYLDYDYFQDVEIPTIRESQLMCTHRFSNIDIYVVPKSSRDKSISYITVVPARKKRPSLAKMRRNYCIKVSRNNIELRFNADYFYNDPIEDFVTTLFNLLISANKSRMLDIQKKEDKEDAIIPRDRPSASDSTETTT